MTDQEQAESDVEHATFVLESRQWQEALPCPAVIVLDTATCDLPLRHEGDHMFAGQPFEPLVVKTP